MYLFTLFSDIHGIHCMESFVKRIWISFVGNFVLRMSDLGGGGWSMTLKNRGRSKKTEGRTRQKSKGGSLAVGIYLQKRQCVPPRIVGVCGGTGRRGWRVGTSSRGLIPPL